MRAKKLTHFSHPHPIREFRAKVDGLVCSCCEQGLSGPAFKCNESICNYAVHKSCVELPQRISHLSHQAHLLNLLSAPAGGFSCNACGETGSAYSFNCSDCDYDLHVKCASFTEMLKREDHKHPLTLSYSFENNLDEVDFLCDVCEESIKHGYWAYCCVQCDIVAHLNCASDKPNEAEKKQNAGVCEEVRGSSNAMESAQALIDAQIRQQQEMQLEMMRSNRHRSQMHSMRMSQVQLGFIG